MQFNKCRKRFIAVVMALGYAFVTVAELPSLADEKELIVGHLRQRHQIESDEDQSYLLVWVEKLTRYPALLTAYLAELKMFNKVEACIAQKQKDLVRRVTSDLEFAGSIAVHLHREEIHKLQEESRALLYRIEMIEKESGLVFHLLAHKVEQMMAQTAREQVENTPQKEGWDKYKNTIIGGSLVTLGTAAIVAGVLLWPKGNGPDGGDGGAAALVSACENELVRAKEPGALPQLKGGLFSNKSFALMVSVDSVLESVQRLTVQLRKKELILDPEQFKIVVDFAKAVASECGYTVEGKSIKDGIRLKVPEGKTQVLCDFYQALIKKCQAAKVGCKECALLEDLTRQLGGFHDVSLSD